MPRSEQFNTSPEKAAEMTRALQRMTSVGLIVAAAALGSTLPAASASPASRVSFTIRVCASDQTPTSATIRYAVGVGESTAESGTTNRWLGAGCWARTVNAYSYDTANVRAVARNQNAYIGCAVWVSGRRIAKDYAHGSCQLSGIRG